MSKINSTSKTASMPDENRLAGGFGKVCAQETPILALRRVVLANLLWEDNFYVDGQKVSNEIARLIPLCEARDVANLALESRVLQKLRHTPLYIISEMCKYEAHKQYVKDLLPKVCTRPDMLTDFLAIYWKDGKKPLPNQVKKGLAEAFHNFNEYQLAKYDRDSSIKLRDVLFLTHPKAKNAQEQELFEKVAKRTLSTPDTWEVSLSSGADKKETWTRLIEEHKLGGLAMLRNINNMKQASVEKSVISKGIDNISSAMLLPLDFYKAAKYGPEFKKEIEQVMTRSYKNLPKLPGKTLFIVDCSGSMQCGISGKSVFNRLQCAIAMAMLASFQCEDYKLVITAGDDRTCKGAHSEIEYPIQGFGLEEQIDKMSWSKKIGNGGIFTNQVLKWSKKHFEGQEFERVIIFSDSQDCDRYDKSLPEPFGKYNYICDVSSEKKGINYKGVWTAEISGWSEHFLTYISAFEGLDNVFEE